MIRVIVLLVQLAADAVRWSGLVLRSRRSIDAENLFLRRQLALYIKSAVRRRDEWILSRGLHSLRHRDYLTGKTL